MRELVFLFEQHQQAWAKDLYDLFLEMAEFRREKRHRRQTVVPRNRVVAEEGE
jgi:hypothetical protein